MGVFVAPVKGYYFFSYRDTTLKSSRYTVAQMFKNKEVVAIAHAHSGDNKEPWLVTPFSLKATLLMMPGDEVYVEEWCIGTNVASTTEERSPLTIVFTGYLLNSIA